MWTEQHREGTWSCGGRWELLGRWPMRSLRLWTWTEKHGQQRRRKARGELVSQMPQKRSFKKERMSSRFKCGESGRQSSLGTQRQMAGPWQVPSPSGARSWWVCHCLSIHCCEKYSGKMGIYIGIMFQKLFAQRHELSTMPTWGPASCSHVYIYACIHVGSVHFPLELLVSSDAEGAPPSDRFLTVKEKGHTCLQEFWEESAQCLAQNRPQC